MSWSFDGDELVITKGSWVIDRYRKNKPATDTFEGEYTNHPQQQEAQSITVKPDTASVSTNRASAGNRSNQKLTEVSSGLTQQQESMTTSEQIDWSKRFDKGLMKHLGRGKTVDWIKQFIASELQAQRHQLIEEVEGWLDKMPIYEVDDAPPEFCAGYNECVSAWKTYVLELKSNLTALKKGNE